MTTPSRLGTRGPAQRLVGASCLALVVLAWVGAAAAQAGQPAPTPARIVFIVQRTDASADWAAIRNGARAAADLTGLDLDYRTVPNWRQMEGAIEAAIDSDPQGLVIASPDRARLDEVVERVGSARIPLIAARWIGEAWQPDEVLARVGVDQQLTGRAAGEQLVEQGVTHAICVKAYLQVADLALRCQAAADVLTQAGGRMEELVALDPPGDPTGIQGAIAARLRLDPSIDGVLLSGTERVEQAARAIASADEGDRIAAGVIGSDPATQAALDAGALDFAVTSQPYLEGYLPVSFLSLYLDQGLVAGAGQPVLTGPVVIEADASPPV